jgi:plasmid stabilization system protein ParE
LHLQAEKGVLFRGLRARMSIATGGVDSIRLHSVTQRAEYVGEVLRKVQAVGETPHGGQVRGSIRAVMRSPHTNIVWKSSF